MCCAAVVALVACGDSTPGMDPTTSPVDTGGAAALVSSPPFVNRLIPGRRPVSIVQLVGDLRSPVDLVATSTLTDAVVTVEPSSITGGGVAEVWIEIPEVVDEISFSLTVAPAAGVMLEPVTIDAVAVPGVDDLADQATEIAGLFIDRIEEEVPGLPADAKGLIGGTPVAGLLVVTHYAWFTAEAEIGVAWHIMVAPDDFAELYVRPRDQLRPTRAFRVSSWSTALAGGDVQIEEITPPPDVMR